METKSAFFSQQNQLPSICVVQSKVRILKLFLCSLVVFKCNVPSWICGSSIISSFSVFSNTRLLFGNNGSGAILAYPSSTQPCPTGSLPSNAVPELPPSFFSSSSIFSEISENPTTLNETRQTDLEFHKNTTYQSSLEQSLVIEHQTPLKIRRL